MHVLKTPRFRKLRTSALETRREMGKSAQGLHLRPGQHVHRILMGGRGV